LWLQCECSPEEGEVDAQRREEMQSDGVIRTYPEYEDWDIVAQSGEVVARMRSDVITGDPQAVERVNALIRNGLMVGIGVTVDCTPQMVAPFVFALQDPLYPDAVKTWKGLTARRANGVPIKDLTVHTYWSCFPDS